MEVRVCRDCGVRFTMSESEIAFFEKKKLMLPKRCISCREVRKLKQENRREK